MRRGADLGYTRAPVPCPHCGLGMQFVARRDAETAVYRCVIPHGRLRLVERPLPAPLPPRTFKVLDLTFA